MTEKKLPEVGKRYNWKRNPNRPIEVIGIKKASDGVDKVIFWEEVTETSNWYDIDDFCKEYEEIPDSSQPEESKPNAVREAINKTCNKIFDCLDSDISDRRRLKWAWREIDEDVKQEIRDGWNKLFKDAINKNLISALEAERAMVNPTIPQKPVSGIAEYTKACEHGDKYPLNITKYNDDNSETDIVGCYACEQETMKEKPKSIWRPVSELPELTSYVLIKDYIGRKNIFLYDGNHKLFINILDQNPINQDIISSYCLLTDFINEHEDLKARVERLENINFNK